MSGPPREAGPRRIAGYELEGILGRGGTSRVFVARHARLERRVALKLFEVREGTPANAVPRLLREAKLLARLDHENVVRCFDFGEQDGRVYLVLELVDGRSLKQRLDEEGPLAEEEALRIALGVARALEHAHAHGIVHRDVKPGNVLLDPEGRVKLTDFGLAKTGEGLDLTLPGTMIGTPQYLSPEQARSPKQADERSDLYSLGATLYHMLTGRPPHVGESLTAGISDILFSPIVPPERVRPGISTATSRVVARLLARQRGLRTRTAAEAIADLERAARPVAGADLPGLSWEEAGHETPSRRRAWRVAGGAAAGVVAIALLVALFRAESGPEDGTPAPPETSVRQDRPFEPGDLAAGRIGPAEAWSSLAALPAGPPKSRLEAAVVREATERARLLGVRASSVARREVAAGRLETALDAFDAEVGRGAASALGAPTDALPAPLAEALDAGTAEARRTVADELVGRAARRANDEIEIDLDRLSGELLGLVTARRYAEGLERVDRELAAADERVAELFAVAVRSVVPESRNARPSPEWRARAAESYRAALSRLKRLRLERAVDEAKESARRALAAWRVPDGASPDRDEIARGVRGAVEEALGVASGALPGEPGPLRETIEARVEQLDLEVRERERSARRRLEAAVAADVEAALARRDVAAATAAAERLGEARVLDPWLAQVVAALPGARALEAAAFDALERERGRATEVWVRGIRRRGQLVEVDREARTLRFDPPRFDVRFDEIETHGLVALAGDAVDPRAAAVMLHHAGRPEDVDAVLEAYAGDPRLAALRPVLEARRAALRRQTSDREEEARERLAAFDAAVAAGDPEEIARAGESILLDGGLRGLEPVAARQRSIQRAVEQAERDVRTARARETVRARTRAEATFHDDGTVDLVHGFRTGAELDDFELPGAEWGIRGDALSSVPSEGRRGPTDGFVHRPGVERALPFDPSAPMTISFDLEFPFEQGVPTLFGVRLLSTCFVVRSFGEGELPGQVNAWTGDLDDFRGHVFEPALGETRPRRKGEPREHSFRRGERVRVELERQPSGAEAEVRLRVDGDVVYRYVDEERPRASGLEIRSRTPIVVRDLRLSGRIPGTERRLR